MRRRLIGVLAGASLIAVVPAVPVAAAPSKDSPVAQAACTRAKIGGQSRCIARGQYCAKRYESDYRKYGYSCSKKDRRGRWHLQ
ncbi:hypothetical protein Q5424_04980 [Conexibacter sp. JD483]|uniref:hypothetical protein n=1 Tax=unclassified Conexibacter TaxID=2627773 RepID=UPI0027168293|nr:MULTISPECIES: hypothetical protein [unclassified Conexibacter]MDO8184687.1 hypothetical protein [Conexibacter sp. CPCC 205706]MDO8197993.1 hypothetical protein [Conexibacter sp. CPCC 205762]MDR9368423.1 hypothetical protein [Conexibacter sp. JD483]